MSGGVGPTGDIHLPKEEEQPPLTTKPTRSQLPKHHKPGFLTLRQLNALAVFIVLSASGLVSIEDTIFVIFSLIYIYFLQKIALPMIHHTDTTTPHIDLYPKTNLSRIYNFVGFLVGIFLPVCYIFEGIYEGDKEGISAAVPHVFLLASQFFMEGIVETGERFSLPVRVYVPLFYNAKRVLMLMDLVRGEVMEAGVENRASMRRLIVGRWLAVLNLVYWGFHLLGFLLPVYLPKAFKIYYGSNSNPKDVKD